MSMRLTLRKKSSVEDLLNAILQLPSEIQLALAERVRSKALRSQWNNFIKSEDSDPDISTDEIVAEVKAVRKARYARRKK
jgi:hypothetical protein